MKATLSFHSYNISQWFLFWVENVDGAFIHLSQPLNNPQMEFEIQFLKFFTRATIYLSSGLAKISNFPKRTPKLAFIFWVFIDAILYFYGYGIAILGICLNYLVIFSSFWNNISILRISLRFLYLMFLEMKIY